MTFTGHGRLHGTRVRVRYLAIGATVFTPMADGSHTVCGNVRNLPTLFVGGEP